MKTGPALLLIAAASPLHAQISPVPGTEDPRLQTLIHEEGRRVRLVAFPESSLTLIIAPGDRIERVELSDSSAFQVVVTGDSDSLGITPLRPEATATMAVETRMGRHEYDLETGRGLAAAYIVRVLGSADEFEEDFRQELQPDLAAMTGRYRLKGDRSLQPRRIADDGYKTYIEWGPEQSLPAVLGIGPTGEEEVVAGHMRGGLFTIDRVYSELVFRIDREKTTAVREREGARQ
jgi:type IV secretion system protein VirB9